MFYSSIDISLHTQTVSIIAFLLFNRIISNIVHTVYKHKRGNYQFNTINSFDSSNPIRRGVVFNPVKTNLIEEEAFTTLNDVIFTWHFNFVIFFLGQKKKKQLYLKNQQLYKLILARACGVPVGRRSGGQLAMTLVATINLIIFFFFFFFLLRPLLFS